MGNEGEDGGGRGRGKREERIGNRELRRAKREEGSGRGKREE
jgi:hypothetical protein